MPSVDIPTSTNAGEAGSKQGFGTGLPTPVLLAFVGGGIGLVVFLMRKQGTNTGTGADKGTLLPNTAIMLGSLQQGILQLQGDVTSGNADLSSQLTGVGENLGTQIDAQTGQIQQYFSGLNTYLGTNFQTIQGTESALSQAIAALGTQNADLASSLATALGNLQSIGSQVTATQNQIAANQGNVNAGLESLGQQLTNLSGQVQINQQGLISISNGVNAIQNQQNVMQSQLTTIGNRSQLAVGQYFKWWDSSANRWGIGKVNQDGQLQGFSTWTGYINSGGSPDQSVINAYPTIAFTTSYGGTGGQSWAATVISQ